MTDRPSRRLVYSTGTGPLCSRCGHPQERCACADEEEAVPDRIVAKLRLETKGRGGKAVTVVYDLPRNRAFLEGLARELKRTVGTGGGVGDGTVELQGDRRERVRGILVERGFVVKG